MKKEVLDIAAKMDADNELRKVNKQLFNAIQNKDFKAIEQAEDRACRIDLDIVDSELLAEFDELYSQAFKMLN